MCIYIYVYLLIAAPTARNTAAMLLQYNNVLS